MAKRSARDALLDAGMRAFLEKGYNHAGIEAILQAAGVPKGSFYYYFPSKEDFGLRVLDRFAEAEDACLASGLDDPAVPPLERLRRRGEAILAHLGSADPGNGCLVGKLSLEMADQSEAFRDRLDRIFDRWVDFHAACFEEARRDGSIPAHYDPRRLAEFWLCGVQGAALRAKISRSTAPLRTFLDVMFDVVLKAPETPEDPESCDPRTAATP